MIAPSDGITSANQLGYRLRNVTFDSALVLEENLPSKIKTTLTPNYIGSHGPWYHFKVTSYTEGVAREHSAGLIRLEKSHAPVVTDHTADPLGQTTSGKLWYKAMATVGYGFGPLFQKHLEVEATSGHRSSRSLVDLSEPESLWPVQSPYPLHPAALDGSFQTVTPSLVAGIRSNIKSVLIPAIIDELTVYPNTSRPTRGISHTTSEYVGKGRLDDDKNFLSNATVHHPSTKQILVRLSGLRYHRLDTGYEPLAAHTLSQISWKEDVTFYSPRTTLPGHSSFLSAADEILDLIAHKKPLLKVLEVNLNSGDTGSVWFDRGDGATRAAYLDYTLASGDATALVDVQAKYGSRRSSTFALTDYTKPAAHEGDTKYDAVVLKGGLLPVEASSQVYQNIRLVLAEGGYALFLQGNTDISSDNEAVSEAKERCHSGVIEFAGLRSVTRYQFDDGQQISLSTLEKSKVPAEEPEVKLFSFGGSQRLSTTIAADLRQAGKNIRVSGSKDFGPSDVVLVLDELTEPLLTNISSEQWEVLQNLIASRAKILWVTHGSQIDVTHPAGALIHGLLRTIRSEDPGLSLTTLDVEAPALPATATAISSLLSRVAIENSEGAVESEYVERKGIIYVSRVLPDEKVNAFKSSQTASENLQSGSLRDQETLVRLRAERIGALDGLVFGEIAPREIPVGPNHVEVDIFAAGLNFKVSAITHFLYFFY